MGQWLYLEGTVANSHPGSGFGVCFTSTGNTLLAELIAELEKKN
jgi:hypothetical protein